MRLYQKIKNIGGGFSYEFINCVNGLYNAAKYRDITAVEIYYKKLDKWRLEWTKQNKIMWLGRNDGSIGIPVFTINKILKG